MNKVIHSLPEEPTDENIQKVMEKYRITGAGFSETGFRPNNEVIRFIHNNFNFLFQERTKFAVGSYSAKHYVEHFRKFMGQKDGYVSNGELIIALILSGIPFKTDGSLNCVFKCSYRDEITYLIHNSGKLKNRYFSNENL